MAKEIYDSDSIKELSDLDHIRLRPGMYIGGVDNPNKLFDEVFDNSLDEAQNGYCDSINVTTAGRVVAVADTGRGIPVAGGILKKITNKLFTSGKFDNDSYKISAGLHGVGMTVVNALSSNLEIMSNHMAKTFGHLIYENQKVVKDIEIDSDPKVHNQGTMILFEPCNKIFRSTNINNAYILDRINLSSALIPSTKFNFNNQTIKYSLSEYIRKQLDITNKDIELYHFKTKTKKGEQLSIHFAFNDVNIGKGSVNIKPCNQGTHINFIRELICNKIIETDKSLLLKDIFNLKIYVDAKIGDANYSGQTKERLDIEKKYLVKEFQTSLETLLSSMIEQNPDGWQVIIDQLNAHKQFLLSKKNIGTAVTGSRSKYISVDGLRDCSVFDENSELFIVEGKSAAGSIISCREPKQHAIIALKGKVLNVETADFDKFMKNKELKNLFTAFGTGIRTDKTKEDLSKLRYGKICLSSDADPDGAHITCLMITAILKFTPDLIRAGRVYIVDMPLYGYTHKKKFHPVFDGEEARKLRSKYHITRFKGLGEFDPSEMREVALNPNSRRLIQLKMTDKVEEVIKLMSDSSKKKELMQIMNLVDESL